MTNQIRHSESDHTKKYTAFKDVQLDVPRMIRLGYRPRFAVGSVAGSSVLGMPLVLALVVTFPQIALVLV